MNENSKTYDDPTELLDMRLRLDDQLKSIKIALAAAKLPNETKSLSELQELVTNLQKELLEESAKTSMYNCLVQRFQLSQALCDRLFSPDEENIDLSCEKRCIEERELTFQLMRIGEETKELQDKVQKKTMENLRLKRENQELMQRLKARQEEKQAVSADANKNTRCKKLRNELQTMQQMVKISQHIGQMLVLHLDENELVQDDMKNFLLECGETIDT